MTSSETIRALINVEFKHPLDRIAAGVLAQSAQDLALQDGSPHYQTAVVWFYTPWTGDVTLQDVCRLLDLPVWRVQKAAAAMEARLMTASYEKEAA